MTFKTSKISAFRLWGLGLILSGMFLMVLGTAAILLWGNLGKIITGISLVLGTLLLFASMFIYFWAGMLSSQAVLINCPSCSKQTKMLGKNDRCMFCHTRLTLDPHSATG